MMQISSNRYNIQTPASQTASIMSGVGLIKGETGTSEIKVRENSENIDSLNSSATSLQYSLAASALDRATSGTEFNYIGPNLAAVTATNDKAIASGLSGGYDLNEILTDEDKAITGFDANDPSTFNAAAHAIADARYRGKLDGNITADFLSTLQGSYELSDAIIQGMEYRLSQIFDNSSSTSA